jgi:hypothetical protein
MDIHLCIDYLGLNNNSYRLTQSNPPHEFISWDGPDPQPTQAELDAAWTEIQTAHDAKAYVRTRAAAYPLDADFKEAYTEKEIGGDSTKWDAYVIAYNKVRTDNPK